MKFYEFEKGVGTKSSMSVGHSWVDIIHVLPKESDGFLNIESDGFIYILTDLQSKYDDSAFTYGKIKAHRN